VELATGETITMVGGRYRLNDYNNQVYENYLSGIIAYTNGEVFTSVNYAIRNLQPYDGVGTRSLPDSKIRDEYYKGYDLTENAEVIMASMPHTQRISLGMVYVIPVL
jgi:hypothetical protein